MTPRHAASTALTLAAIITAACGGGSSPTTPTPVSTPTPAPTPTVTNLVVTGSGCTERVGPPVPLLDDPDTAKEGPAAGASDTVPVAGPLGVCTGTAGTTTIQLTATASLSNGSTQNVTSQAQWSSTNLNVATVSNGGLVTLRAAGEADVLATYSGRLAGHTVRVSPAGPRTSFGTGRYLVNSDIAAGRYFSDPQTGCYWERLSGLGGTLGEIIANEFIGFDAGQWIVDIAGSDRAFRTDAECGTWFRDAPRRGAVTNIPPGMWLVNNQVRPGTYRAQARSGCYWQRLRNFGGRTDGIIANDFVSGGGQVLVTIGAGDLGFSADDDCGEFTPA